MTTVETPLTTEAVSPKQNQMKKVTRDSFWILANYGVTALSGMLFWVVAARIVSPGDLGYETAVLSIVTAAATMASVGSGNGLLAMLPASGKAASPLLKTATTGVVLLSGVYGIIAGILVALFLPHVIPGYLIVPAVALVTVLWSLFVFKDPVFGGLGHLKSAVVVNGSANILKLILLLVGGLLLGSIVHPVISATVVPAIFAVTIWGIFLVPRMLRSETRLNSHGNVIVPKTDEDAKAWYAKNKKPYMLYAFRDGTASSFNLGISMSLPFLVSAIAGTEGGAVFALTTQVSNVLDLVVVGLAGSLILNSAAGHADAPRLAVRMWLRVVAVVAVLAVAIIIASPLILGFLGSFYVASGGVQIVAVLVAGSVFRTAFEVWCSLLRAEHKTGVLLLQNSITAAILLPLAIGLTIALGALGCALAIFGVTICQFGLGLYGILKARRKSIEEANG